MTMQFLPFFTLFFLVFAAISASFVSSELSDGSEALSYQGRLRALRLAHSEHESKLYKREFNRLNKQHKEKNHPKNEGGDWDQEEGEKTARPERDKYFRIARMGSFYGAIYLEKCVRNDVDSGWLKKISIDYLKAVYGNARFISKMKNPHWAEELLSFIIAQEKEAYEKHGCFLPLDQLCPEGDVSNYYFRLIRGTNNCDPLLDNGFLPLERCITFQKKPRPAINMHFANPQLLMTLFGKGGYEQICDAEQSGGRLNEKGRRPKDYSLDRNQLKSLLQERFQPVHDRNIDHTFRAYQRVKHAYDPETLISEEIIDPSAH